MSQLTRRSLLKGIVATSTAACVPARIFGASETAAALRTFKLGAISDGFADDFEEALKLMKGYGLEWVEIRHIWGAHLQHGSHPGAGFAKYAGYWTNIHFHVSVVSTALYKCTLPGTTPVGNHKRRLPLFRADGAVQARRRTRPRLGTKTLRGFTFWRVEEPEKIAGRMAEELEKAAAVASGAGVRLAIEDEGTCNVGTGHELARLLADCSSSRRGRELGCRQSRTSAARFHFPLDMTFCPRDRIWAHAFERSGLRDPREKMPRIPLADQGSIDSGGPVRALRRDHDTGTISLECENNAPGMSHLQTTQRSMEGLLKVAVEAAA